MSSMGPGVLRSSQFSPQFLIQSLCLKLQGGASSSSEQDTEGPWKRLRIRLQRNRALVKVQLGFPRAIPFADFRNQLQNTLGIRKHFWLSICHQQTWGSLSIHKSTDAHSHFIWTGWWQTLSLHMNGLSSTQHFSDSCFPAQPRVLARGKGKGWIKKC